MVDLSLEVESRVTRLWYRVVGVDVEGGRVMMADAEPGGGPRQVGEGEGRKHPLASLDPVLHAPARLMIATHLYVVKSADAVFVQSMTGLTWGNLATHVRKLEAAGYATVEKSFSGRKPRTVIALTDTGREALRAYRAAMLRGLGRMDG